MWDTRDGSPRHPQFMSSLPLSQSYVFCKCSGASTIHFFGRDASDICWLARYSISSDPYFAEIISQLCNQCSIPWVMPLSTVQGSECLHYLKTHYNTTLQELVAVWLGLTNDPLGTLTEILRAFLDDERWGKEAKDAFYRWRKGTLVINWVY